MTYDEAQRLTDGLRERFNTAFSPSDKTLIKRLYNEVLGKTFRQTSCQRCYHDAVIEIALHLRKTKTMTTKKNYTLRSGFIISCPDFHNGQHYTNDNLTDEIAAEYLAKYPNMAKYFATIPEKAVSVASTATKPVNPNNTLRKARKPRKTNISEK